MSRDGMHGLDTGRCLACECAIFRPASCEGWWICGRCADAEQLRHEGAAVAFGIIALGEWARRTAAASFAYVRVEWSVLPVDED